mgnify:CR=1 FL=1
MGLFERYLTVWVALAIFAGMGAGAIAPDLFASVAALEYAQEGIMTNAIAPGAILTPMVTESFKQVNPDDPEKAQKEFAQQNPTKFLQRFKVAASDSISGQSRPKRLLIILLTF